MTVAAVIADMIYYRNADFRRRWRLADADGAAIDVTGWTFEFAVAAAPGAGDPEYLFPVAIDDAAEGRFSLDLPPAAVPAGEWAYEILSIDRALNRTIRQSGALSARDGVTQPLALPLAAPDGGMTVDFVSGLARQIGPRGPADPASRYESAVAAAIVVLPAGQILQTLKFIRTPRGRLVSASITRCEYDADGQPLGAHVERESENLFTFSGDAGHADWTRTAVAAAAGGDGPVDGLAMTRLTEDTSANIHAIGQRAPVVRATRYSMSCFARGGRGRGLALNMQTTIPSARAVFDLDAGTAQMVTGGELSGGVGTFFAGIETFAGGIHRCSMSGVAEAEIPGGGAHFRFALDHAGMFYSGDGVSGIDIWGMQLETGPPTSYIATVATPATREEDRIEIFPRHLVVGRTAGALRIEARHNGVPVGPASHYCTLATDDRHRTAFWQDQVNPSDIRWLVEDDTVQVNRRLAPATPGGFFTAAARLRQDDFAWSVDGGAVDTDDAGTMPDLTGGTLTLRGGDGDYHIRSLTYLPSAPDAAALRETTT